MTKPLRVALLWHQHQPYYRVKDEFVLPWVRLHAIKDYADLAQLHFEFPSLRLCYNIVPSLLIQLDEYQKGIEDRVLQLTRIDAEQLQSSEKQEILQSFFRCHHAEMLFPYDRFRELYEQSRDNEYVNTHWTAQEWRDLQVWYNLCWTGPISRTRSGLQRLFHKARGFTEVDKRLMLAEHRLIIGSVVSLLQELYSAGVAELSMTPLHHPIMPLVVDTDVATQADPEIVLPLKRYRQQHDAEWHLKRGAQVFQDHCNTSAHGVWCSEGSLSDEVLDMLVEAGIEWTATDEQVLRATKNQDFREGDQYFVHWFARERRKPIALFFRDHHLSDAIGFVYQSWDPHDAARDFVQRLKSIRESLIQERGVDALDHAVVPIILDGENCWEYYKENGIHFLRALYAALSSDKDIQTCTFHDVTQTEQTEFNPLRAHESSTRLEHLRAGSWINANFRIWIGQSEKNTAWDALHAARILVDAKRVTRSQWREAMEHIYIAEGSDWFWWFGDDHKSETRHIFDELFRFHLRCVYEIYREEIPSVLRQPIMKPQNQSSSTSFSTMHAVDNSR